MKDGDSGIGEEDQSRERMLTYAILYGLFTQKTTSKDLCTCRSRLYVPL